MGKVNEREALNEMMEIGWICCREYSMRDDGDFVNDAMVD